MGMSYLPTFFGWILGGKLVDTKYESKQKHLQRIQQQHRADCCQWNSKKIIGQQWPTTRWWFQPI